MVAMTPKNKARRMPSQASKLGTVIRASAAMVSLHRALTSPAVLMLSEPVVDLQRQLGLAMHLFG